MSNESGLHRGILFAGLILLALGYGRQHVGTTSPNRTGASLRCRLGIRARLSLALITQPLAVGDPVLALLRGRLYWFEEKI